MREKTRVNYLWIGPPANTISGGVPGHDVMGPLQMIGHIDDETTELHFWCLEEYCKQYQTIFLGKNITVNPIEKLLYLVSAHGLEESTRDFSKKVSVLFQKLLATGRASIRDYVTLKDVFALFLFSA